MNDRAADDDPPARPAVTVAARAGDLCAQDLEWVAARGSEAVAHLGAVGEVRVLLVDDAAMADAHERHCGVAGTTDVITFDLAEGAGASGAPLDVDLVVCVDEARRQASARGIPARREVLLYVVHGVLHCLGYDDHDEAASAAMHAREDEVLAAIGVGATYGVREHQGADLTR